MVPINKHFADFYSRMIDLPEFSIFSLKGEQLFKAEVNMAELAQINYIGFGLDDYATQQTKVLSDRELNCLLYTRAINFSTGNCSRAKMLFLECIKRHKQMEAKDGLAAKFALGLILLLQQK